MASLSHAAPAQTSRGQRARGIWMIVAAALAFLAGQHHNLHMLAIALGLGSAGGSFMQGYPWLRRGMLLVSLIVAAANVLALRRMPMSRSMRWWMAAGIGLTAGLVLWSIVRFGF